MSFYQAMQLSAANIKPLIREASDSSLRKKYITALIVKNILCITFCISTVILFSRLFGSENSIVGVVSVMSILTFRASNLDFRTGQATITLIGIFIIFAICPQIAVMVNPVIAMVINILSILIIVILSCHNVLYSNQSILVLSYLLLYGYEVNDINVYINRVIGLLFGGIIVALIFYFKQRKVKYKNRFLDIIKDVDFSNDRTKWQLKLAIGISVGMFIGEIFNIQRVMWIGFACMSILQPATEKIEIRTKQRPIFMIVGCMLYATIYLLTPESYRSFISIFGGLMVGFSATYQWQTSFNCFGALTVAVPVLGLWPAIILRLITNIFGAIYSKVFNYGFNFIDERISNSNSLTEVG